MAVNSDFVEEKELMPELFESSVVKVPPDGTRGARAHPLILQLATSADTITPWGVNVQGRDRQLREFWHTESFLASAVYGVSIRNASFAWEIKGTDPTKPRPRNTINKVEQIISRSNRGKGWYDLILKTCIDLYCLAGKTKVKLGGDRLGKTKTIARMVKDRDPGPVISVGSDGTLVEQTVTEWHSTPLGNRKWYFLSTKLATNHGQGGKQGGIFLTEDHPMLTDRGWVQAKDLLPTDKIGTSDLVPSEEQAEVLVGGLLGDMSMSRFTKRAIIRFGHSIDQSDYLEFKKSLLKEFGWTGQNSRLTEKGTYITEVTSIASLGLSTWFNRWYPDGKKRVNREDFVKHFSPRMLAIWFMDDGACQRTLTTANNQSEHAVLCTDGFEKEDVEWIAEELISRGFSCKVQQIKDKYYRIRFTADGYRAVVSYISEYVIPSMQYKMGQHTKSFNSSVWELEPATIYFDEIEQIEQKDYMGATGRVVETTYHIGVDKTRNFIAGNLVSHNTVDNGAFWEIIRVDNNNPTSPPMNFAHLDSGRCWRTGDPEYPIIYTDYDGIEHPMPWWRVETLEEFPSPIETMYGIQYCLYGDSTVRMADGTTRRIRELVNSKSDEYVLSMDEDGTLVPKKIINWYKNPLNGRRLLNIRGELISRNTRGNKDRNSWVTEDHPILTPGGWIPAGKINPGDEIVTEAPGLSQEQIELLIGTLMGDSSLSCRHKTPRLTVGHGMLQQEWLETKASAFGNLGVNVHVDATRGTVHMETKAQPALEMFYKAFYETGKKRFPVSLIKQYLSPRLLAAWFMDDGTTSAKYRKKTGDYGYSASIGTTSQPIDILIELSVILTKAGYECRVVKAGYENKYNVRFTVAGSERLFKDISPYILPCLRYKLPEMSEDYSPDKWNIADYTTRFVDRAVVKDNEKLRVANVYCIDVEDTHNFISAGIVVHNCAVTRALMAAQILRDIAVYKKEKVGGNFTRAIDIIGGVSRTNIDDAILLAEEQNLNRGLYRYSQPVIIPGVDPTHPLSHVHIDLATLPESFNEDVTFKWYIAQLALAFGVDYQEFAPLMSGNLGSSSQSEILHLKTRGKGPAMIMTMLEDKINSHLPENVEFRFKEQDVRSDRERAEARFTRAKERALLVRSGEIDPTAARQMAVEAGDLPEWMVPGIETRLQAMETAVETEEIGVEQIAGGIDSHIDRKIFTKAEISLARQLVSALEK